MRTCDKKRIPLRVGDILKVFHFTGARRKKHYMYKQVTRSKWMGGYGGKPKVLMFFISHLNLKPETDRDGGYWMGLDGGVLEKYEIVQSPDCRFEEREKVEEET